MSRSSDLNTPGIEKAGRRRGLRETLLLAALFIAMTTGLLAPTAAEPRTPVAVYCSPSGDLCQGVFRYKGRIKFSLGLAARYFSRVDICVRNPAGLRTCRGVRVRRSDGFYEALIAFAKNYPSSKRGRYKVTWASGGSRIGKALYFRKR